MTIKCFEDLENWQDARDLCKNVRKITLKEPFIHDYKFKDQLNRSSGSIMNNIAEGLDRDGSKEFRQFLSISKGSCGEARSQCYRAFDSGYISREESDELIHRTLILSQKISNFIN